MILHGQTCYQQITVTCIDWNMHTRCYGSLVYRLLL